jgi:predicted transcriptional regulator
MVVVAVPEMTIQDAAKLMAELDAWVLPVSDKGTVVGMITDRDIAVRAVALGLLPDTTVEDVMTPQVRWCFADDELAEVLGEMGREQIRRMPVLDAAKSSVGIVSLSDLIVEAPATETADALSALAILSALAADRSPTVNRARSLSPSLPARPGTSSSCRRSVNPPRSSRYRMISGTVAGERRQ